MKDGRGLDNHPPHRRLSALAGDRRDPSGQRPTTASQRGPATVTGFGTSMPVPSRLGGSTEHDAAARTRAPRETSRNRRPDQHVQHQSNLAVEIVLESRAHCADSAPRGPP